MSVSTEPSTGRAWVEVDLRSIVANARTVQRAAGGASLLPMVKANAYGLGMLPVVRVLQPLDPWGFGVATVEEGGELRAAGITRPIVVFTPVPARDLKRCRHLELRPVLDDPRVIGEWQGPYHLEIDTGMGRAGLPWRTAPDVLGELSRAPEGLFTHLHSADQPVRGGGAPPSVQIQLERFERVVTAAPQRPSLVHVGNSAGTWFANDEFDLVRPGIFLYGGGIGPDRPRPAAVVSLKAKIVSLRVLEPGDTVSYGAEWTAEETTTVATLGIGYADGVSRSIQGRGEVLYRGRRRPIVGRVTMDMTMIDVGSAPDPPPLVGESVTLIGRDGSEAITIDEFAKWAGTISYEVLTGLGSRLSRMYFDR